MNRIASMLIGSAVGLLLAGCGGGSGAPATPQSSTTNHAASATAQSVTISVNIPGRAPAGKARALYVGAGTQSMTVSVTAQGSTPAAPVSNTTGNCNLTTLVCTASLALYGGSYALTVNLYDGPSGTGFLISTGSTTATIPATNNTVNLTFNGVPFAVSAVPALFSLPSGTPASTTLTVTALDADMNTIIGPGSFTLPISIASTSSLVTLGTPASFSAPSPAPLTVAANYNGSAVVCDTPVVVSGTIGTGASAVTGPAGSIVISAGVPCGISINPSAANVASGGGTQMVTVTDPGYSGTISVVTPNVCALSGSATISPSSGTGPSATFTITGGTSNPTGCPISFTDGTNTGVLTVFVM